MPVLRVRMESLPLQEGGVMSVSRRFFIKSSAALAGAAPFVTYANVFEDSAASLNEAMGYLCLTGLGSDDGIAESLDRVGSERLVDHRFRLVYEMPLEVVKSGESTSVDAPDFTLHCVAFSICIEQIEVFADMTSHPLLSPFGKEKMRPIPVPMRPSQLPVWATAGNTFTICWAPEGIARFSA